jgi:predicted nucleotidyltransferase
VSVPISTRCILLALAKPEILFQIRNVVFLDPYREQISALCRKHGVSELHAFGSVLREDFGPNSDVDLLVVFQRDACTNAFHQFFGFKEDVEALLKRRVDLVCYNAIRNPVFKRAVDQSREPVYAA